MLKRILLVQAHPDAKLRERNVLGSVGIAPVRQTLMGLTCDIEPAGAAKRLGKLERLKAGAE